MCVCLWLESHYIFPNSSKLVQCYMLSWWVEMLYYLRIVASFLKKDVLRKHTHKVGIRILFPLNSSGYFLDVPINIYGESQI